jgi:hypothetical protein
MTMMPFLPFGIFVFICLIGIIFERVYYKKLERKPAGNDWVLTTERFIDPGSGQLVDVYILPATGERKYVEVLVDNHG